MATNYDRDKLYATVVGAAVADAVFAPSYFSRVGSERREVAGRLRRLLRARRVVRRAAARRRG